MDRTFSIDSADVVVPDMDAWGLLWDFHTLRQLTDTLPGNSALQNKALVTANKIMNVFGKGSAEEIKQARKVAEEVFGEEWEKKGSKVYEEGSPRAQILGIGNCHVRIFQFLQFLQAFWFPILMLDRYCLAVAIFRDNAESSPLVGDTAWPYGTLPWASICGLTGSTVQMARAAVSNFVWQSQGKGQEWPIHSYWWELGGKWLQYAKWGGTNTAADLRAKVFWEQIRYEKQGRLVTGHFRIKRNLARNHAWCRHRKFFHSEAELVSWRFWCWARLILVCAGTICKWQRISNWPILIGFQSNVFPHSTFNWIGNDGSQVLCHMTPVGM